MSPSFVDTGGEAGIENDWIDPVTPPPPPPSKKEKECERATKGKSGKSKGKKAVPVPNLHYPFPVSVKNSATGAGAGVPASPECQERQRNVTVSLKNVASGGQQIHTARARDGGRTSAQQTWFKLAMSLSSSSPHNLFERCVVLSLLPVGAAGHFHNQTLTIRAGHPNTSGPTSNRRILQIVDVCGPNEWPESPVFINYGVGVVLCIPALGLGAEPKVDDKCRTLVAERSSGLVDR
ncbi:hypothetical protein B0H17DRAFT_1269672 [Mycena rosella]|uniref:Uncharacterized protein n=1 Tax=Mycena rosella TaxID=1033263 RepID=A0AAD7CLL2_MYCRO|nr:hypothetical protein B0H17DRAFT_1269672 [Mycena rosella]